MTTASTPIPSDISAAALRDLLASHGSMRATALAQGWALSSLHRRCKALGIASPAAGRPAAEVVEEEGRAVDFAELMGGGGGKAEPVAKAVDDEPAGGQAKVGLDLEDLAVDEVAPKPERVERHKIDGSPASRRIVALEDEVSRLKAELRRTHRDDMTDKDILESIGLLAAKPFPPVEWRAQPRGTPSGSPGTPIAIFSD